MSINKKLHHKINIFLIICPCATSQGFVHKQNDKQWEENRGSKANVTLDVDVLKIAIFNGKKTSFYLVIARNPKKNIYIYIYVKYNLLNICY